MELADAVEHIKDEITGGEVDCEVNDPVISKFVVKAFGLCRSWYEEPPEVETLQVSGTDQMRYVLKAAFAKVPHILHGLLPPNTPHVTTTSAESDILGLTGYRELGDFGAWEVAERQLNILYDQYWSVMPTYREMGDRYLLEGTTVVAGGFITVIYSPMPQDFSEVTVQKALDWMLEHGLAKTKVAVGRVRSKFEGGDLEFGTDGKDLVQEGNESVRELREALEKLDYRLNASRY